MEDIAFDMLQTIVRKAFDPETISVVVGKVNDAGRRFRVIIRDELAKAEHVFYVNRHHTLAEISEFITNAALKLDLVRRDEDQTHD